MCCEEQSGVPLDTLIFYGGAANAGRMADRVGNATGGAGQVQQSTHINDAVGTLIGGNAPTGGLPALIKRTALTREICHQR